jgi:dTDP-4-amino-4,6-dideoxygalactose transaminase
MKTELAIFGGRPVIQSGLSPYKSIGLAERIAVNRVIDSGSLSGFYGSWGDQFLGGNEVRRFEEAWSETFKVPYAVSVNSNTSGLYAALAAIEVSPGDEVIVPPTTMSATAISPLLYGAVPVFADIEPDTFCLDINSVNRLLTEKTKAVVAVNLFGHPAKLRELADLCRSRGIFLIEDNAQAPLASEYGKYTGTIGDIGIFSLNYHKHIHTGEGGVCTTNNPELALRLQAVRNHSENILEYTKLSPVNMVGFNFRLTEIAAAIGTEQLRKIESEVRKREAVGEMLSVKLADLEGLTVPSVRSGCRHVFYVWAMRIDEEKLGVNRERFGEALTAEGFPNFLGYTRPLYLLPTFQKRIAIGREGWPFTLSNRTYYKGLCENAERLYERELLCFEPCAYDLDESTVKRLIEAVQKVHYYRNRL